MYRAALILAAGLTTFSAVPHAQAQFLLGWGYPETYGGYYPYPYANPGPVRAVGVFYPDPGVYGAAVVVHRRVVYNKPVYRRVVRRAYHR